MQTIFEITEKYKSQTDESSVFHTNKELRIKKIVQILTETSTGVGVQRRCGVGVGLFYKSQNAVYRYILT